MFRSVSAGDMQAVQIVTGAAMALWLAVGYVPGLRAHITRIRGAILAGYFLAGVAIVAHLLLR